jgi:hypothetical protein
LPYFSSDKAELTGKKGRKNLQFRAAANFFCIGEIFMKKTEMLHKYLVSCKTQQMAAASLSSH